MITGRQIKAARALLGWDAAALAAHANMTRETVSNIENNLTQARETTMADIVRAFNDNGLEFIDNHGVRLKPQGVEVLEGADGFAKFYDFIYEHLSKHGGSVCVSGVDEALFIKHQGDWSASYMKRMAKLEKERGDIHMRILVREGDTNFVASEYAKYKWQAKKYFSPTPFYVFGDNLALISFVHEPAPLIILVKSAVFDEAYRHSFDNAWVSAQEPPVSKKRR